MELLPFFEWLESSLLGQASKSYDGVYVIFQTFHLLSLALIGGTVLATDLRLLNVIMRDVPTNVVAEGAHKWFKWGLGVVIFTGIFMLAGVAIKCYTKESFWVKMIALLTGILFVFLIKKPLLNRDLTQVNPWTLKLIAIASIMTWFTVAAAGRWIGFS
ncbi:hypothetical protein NBRC116493_08090 [Aurantivibrio infirmus]